ncbi:MAG: FG-GAP-like repeat-containing protein, partial [Opitutales bacterium]
EERLLWTNPTKFDTDGDGPLGGQQDWTATANAAITSEQVELTDSITEDVSFERLFGIGEQPRIWITFRAQLLAGELPDLSTSTESHAAVFGASGQNEISIWNESSSQWDIYPTPNNENLTTSWNTFQLHLDYVNHQWLLAQNGNLIASGLPFKDTDRVVFSRFKALQSADPEAAGSIAAFDDVKISTTAPSGLLFDPVAEIGEIGESEMSPVEEYDFLNDLVAWFRPEELEQTEITDGVIVDVWPSALDGNPMTRWTGGRFPGDPRYLANDVHGEPAVLLDSKRDEMRTGYHHNYASDPLTIIAVYRQDELSSVDVNKTVVVGDGGLDGGAFLSFGTYNNDVSRYYEAYASGVGPLSGGESISVDTERFVVSSLIYTGDEVDPPNQFTHRIDGVETGHLIYRNSLGEIKLGRNSDGNSAGAAVSELLIFSEALTEEKLDDIESYLADKYGLYHPEATWIGSNYSIEFSAMIHENRWTQDQADRMYQLHSSEGVSLEVIDGLAAWYRPEELGEIGLEDGATIQSWANALIGPSMTRWSGGSYSESNDPRYVEIESHGEPAVLFDSKRDEMRTGYHHYHASDPLTIIAVYRQDELSSVDVNKTVVVGDGGLDGGAFLSFGTYNNDVSRYYEAYASGVGPLSGGESISVDTERFVVSSLIYTGDEVDPPNQFTHRIDGVETGHLIYRNSLGEIKLGRNSDGNSAGAAVSELLIFSEALTEEKLDDIESYLAEKYELNTSELQYQSARGYSIAQNSDTDPFADAQEEILGYDINAYTEFGDKADGSENALTPVILSGQMGVSPNGAATYSLPIELPPGINNLSPQLSLNYSSQAGDGYVGLGWSLSGLSAVSRGGQTRINDGQFRPVSFTDDDPLYLDGQRLIEIGRTPDGSTREYRTEIDAFSRIASYNHDSTGPRRVVVWTKSGLKMEYGVTQDSKYIPYGKTIPLAWNINRVEDTFGNYYTVEYHTYQDSGETYPYRIKYTGSAGVAPTAEVKFFYYRRPDEIRGYVAGGLMLNRRLLDRIEIRSVSQGFRNYDFTYEQSVESRSSRLVSVAVDDFNGHQAIPIAFSYIDDTFRTNTDVPQYVSSVASALDFTDKANALLPADWDGDGATDLLTVNKFGSDDIDLKVRRFNGTDYSEIISQPVLNSGNLGSYDQTQRWLSGDFNGDGFLDLYQVYGTGNFNRDVRVYLNRGNGEFDGAINAVTGISEIESDDIYLAIDMNMDGRSDIVRIDDLGGLGVDVWLSDGTTNTNNQYSRWGNDLWANGDGTLFGDFNGDGLIDIATIFRNSQTSQMESAILINEDSGFVFREIVTYPNAGSESKFVATDLNGDGLSDLVFYEENLGGGGLDLFYFHQNTGTQFLGEQELIRVGLLRDELNHFQFADLNGDQIADLIYLDQNRNLNATYFEQVGNQYNDYKTVTYTGHGIDTGDELVSMPFADYDGDGHVDIAIIEGDGLGDPESFVIFPSDGPTNDMLNSVVHGFGLESKVNYGYTIDPDVYTRGTTAVYPRTDILQPMTVVQSLEMPDGVGGTYTQSYRYACLTSYVDRGLEGFGSYALTDSRNDKTVVTYHRKGFPFTGAVESTATYLGGNLVFEDTPGCFTVEDGYLLSKSVTSGWTVLDYHGDRVTYGYPTTSTSYSYERTGQVLGVEPTPFRTTTTTTALKTFPGALQETYGDAASVTIDYGNGRQKVVSNTWETFANTPPVNFDDPISLDKRWHLGRLRESTVTFKDPVLADVTRETAFTYEPLTGALSTETVEPNDPELFHTTAYTYHWSGQIETTTVTANDLIEGTGYVAKSRTLTNAYSPDGRFLLSVTNDLGHVSSSTFDPVSGAVETETDINDLTVTHTYGAFQRLKRTDTPTGNDTYSEYWVLSRQEVTTYLGTDASAIPPGAVYAGVSRSPGLTTDSYTFFDRFGREIATLAYNGDGQLVRTDQEYNARGLVERQSLPYFFGTQTPEWTQTVYDDIQRVQQQYVPGLGNTFFEYDGLTTAEYRQIEKGTTQLSANYDLVANRTEFIRSATTVDAEDRAVTIEDNEGNHLSYLYDGYGNVRRVVRPQGDFIETTYNRRGFRTQINDPDMGVWTYSYNGFGELVSQTDAKSQTSWMEYDALGRLLERRDLEGTTTWTYDTAPGRSIGKTASVTTTQDGDHTQTYRYDDPRDLGRMHQMTESILVNGATRTFTYDYTFDNYGRAEQTLYPTEFTQDGDSTRFRTQTTYDTTYGHPTSVYNVDYPSEIYWQVADKSDSSGKFDVRGSLQAMTYGSGITTELDFDSTTGFLEFIDTRQGGSSLRSWSYGHNGLGHLTQRGDERGFVETLTYDDLERLQTVSFSDGSTTTDETYSYDLYGNITSRTSLASQAVAGNYTYGDAARRNRLTAVDGFSVNYDLNGNITSARGRSFIWNAYNKVEQITQVTRTAQFNYGIDRQRIFQRYDDSSNGDWRETIYSGGGTYEEQTSYNGTSAETTIVRRVYVSTPVGVVGAFTSYDSMPAKMDYHHYDNQGSVVMTTDELGNIQESFAYDAWGMRRQTANWERAPSIDALFPTGIITAFQTRGYTGHEMMDSFGLINMNGRIYDPELGRFLSPDPFVQFEGMLQNYNRYSYVLNNPLSYTDPSGYFVDKLLGGIIGSTVYNLIPDTIKPYVGIALSFINPAAGLAYNVFHGYQTGGFKGAFLAVASAAISYGIGEALGHDFVSWGREAVRAGAHGLAQGGLAELGGGDFGAGFLSGSVGSFGGSIAQHSGASYHEGLAISAIAGGTASKIGGGSFANGAISASMIWVYNHDDRFEWSSKRHEKRRKAAKAQLQKELDEYNAWLRTLTPEERKMHHLEMYQGMQQLVSPLDAVPGFDAIGSLKSGRAIAGAVSGKVKTWRNLIPDKAPRGVRLKSPSDLRDSEFTGNADFVVTVDGTLHVGQSHAYLANGADVISAGQATFKNGQLVRLNNMSGHFRPHGVNPAIPEAAFNNAGFSATGLYRETLKPK